MAITITRTAWTDDDGTGTTGTVVNNAVKTELYGQIDAALALLLPLAGGTLTGAVTLGDIATQSLIGAGANGVGIGATHASGAIRLFTGGSTERLRVTSGGNLALASTAKLYFDGVDGAGNTYIHESSADVLNVIVGGIQYDFRTTAFFPASDDARSLGQNGNRWTAVWATNGTIQTSDLGAKQDVAPSDLGVDFILALKPSIFTYKNRPNERRHGLVAQDIVAAAKGRSLAGIVVGEDGSYGVNYAALVTPLIAVVQQHEARLSALEAA